MGDDPTTGGRRPVLIHTQHGAVEGCLEVHSSVRTLDYLNLSQKFVPLVAPKVGAAGWGLDGERIGINKEHVLFAAELIEKPPISDARAEAAHYSRVAVAMRMADCDVRGFLHVRGLQDPLTLLGQCRQSFVALTSASIVGPGFELTASFVAVNPRYLLALQAERPGTRELDGEEHGRLETDLAGSEWTGGR
jgi:hypothetical protein